jgi:hypothetical protein
MDEHQWIVESPQHASEKHRVGVGVDVAVGIRLVMKIHMPCGGRERERGGDRYLVALPRAVSQRRNSTAGTQCAAHKRQQQKAAFVRENKDRAAIDHFFLMPGHACASQPSMTSWFRSRAIRGGTCGVMPRRCSQALRYLGFIRTPIRCSMTKATRGAVQRSVMKPNSVAELSSHRSTVAACRLSNLRGRPRPGRIASPLSLRHPRLLQRLSHRQTERSLTSNSSATRSGGSPYSTNRTAKRRTCSADNAFHGINMYAIFTHFHFY